MVLAAIVIAFTESITITGRVTDESGNPIPGVTVMIKGTVRGTVTDQNGFYKITAELNETTIVFSFIGYQTLKEKISGRTVINITMKPDNMKLDEVIVVGYGIRSEMDSSPSMSYEKKSAPASRVIVRGLGSARYNSDFNTEGYAAVNENGYKNTRSNPLSTFSIDVDNASYSNIRRFINLGELPPADAVRIEEMINYFKYSYPEPEGEHPFSVYTEMATCPWNKKHILFQVGLKGKSIDKSTLPPSNLVFLLDVSGSMEDPNKLPLLKSAFGMLVNELRAQDRVAIVVYAGAAGLVLESTPGNRKEGNKQGN